MYSGTHWLVYSCADLRTVAVVSAEENPASPFYFVLTPDEGGYRLDGEGNGDRAASDAAARDLQAITPDQVASLIAETRAAATAEAAHSQGAPRVVNLTADSAPGWLPTIDQEESVDRKSTRLNSSHIQKSRMPSSA